jgi:ankyrin repeat protein
MTISETIWNSEEGEIILLMRHRPEGYSVLLEEAMAKISNVENFRVWKDSKYSLLFVASIEDCIEAVQCLLLKGANPALCNDEGFCVAHFMARRGQLEMIKECYSKLNSEMQLKFVNQATRSGKCLLIYCCAWLL